jgi:ankyrin repeat protein
MYAAYAGQEELVNRLIRAGADVNARSKSGKTALIGAAQYGHAGIVKSLLAAKANANFVEQTQETALMHAAIEWHLVVVQLLMEKGIRENDVRNAFIAAAGEGRIQIVQYFISRGVDVNARNAYGVTPLTVAGHSGQLEVVRALLAAGAKQ